MSTGTTIQWTDATWNPVRGCSRVSAGCDNCYAMRQARRQDRPLGAYEGLTRVGKRGVDWSGIVRLVPELLDQPSRWKKPRRVFVNSMSDLFHESLPIGDIDAVFQTMLDAERHTFQVLTKRPKRMHDYLHAVHHERNPLPNVHLGVSCEDQVTFDDRTRYLALTPAAVRFVSLEPLLGPIEADWDDMKIGWVIVGGESGPGARPMDPDWARDLRDQCKDWGVPFFMKQMGAVYSKTVNGDAHGSDCIPDDLLIREFPA